MAVLLRGKSGHLSNACKLRSLRSLALSQKPCPSLALDRSNLLHASHRSRLPPVFLLARARLGSFVFFARAAVVVLVCSLEIASC